MVSLDAGFPESVCLVRMKLRDLLEGVEIRNITGDIHREIEGIAYHSRQVEKGFLFAAIRGIETDGHQFVDEAVGRGAEAILLEKDLETANRTKILVPDSRKALARIASNLYGDPSSQVRLIGITGTNGKTTTTFLLESMFKKAGASVGIIGTINYRFANQTVPASTTTPESLDLQKILWEMVREGVSVVVMEVSSHGLDLNRVFGCHFDVAIFTNFTSDHLDYHKTLQHYFESKRKLFSEFLIRSKKTSRIAITNQDDPRGEEMVEGIGLPVLRYGLNPSCDVSADQVVSTFEGLSLRLRTPKGEFSVRSNLIGEYNLHNILAAASAGLALGLTPEVLKDGIEALGGVSGRFEKVENRKGIQVIVDYAHTHDALERVFVGLKGIADRASQGTEKLITVFGCGGDRDRTKRPLMGAVAGQYSDLAILTSDNPRTEDPLAIMKDVVLGLKSLPLEEWTREEIGRWRSRKGYLQIPDRREAIRMAIRLARPRDTVLIAGKGHEDYQIIGRKKIPFDDRIEVRKALEEE